MPDLVPNSIPDLTTAHYSESLRRELYDIAARIVFDSDTAPDYSPDESDLAVYYLWGRWIAVWRDLESESDAETPLPLSRAWQVVRLQNDPTTPTGVMLHEV